MIAETAADMILGNERLPADNTEVYRAPASGSGSRRGSAS